jgi:hypothetical protein
MGKAARLKERKKESAVSMSNSPGNEDCMMGFATRGKGEAGERKAHHHPSLSANVSKIGAATQPELGHMTVARFCFVQHQGFLSVFPFRIFIPYR